MTVKQLKQAIRKAVIRMNETIEKMSKTELFKADNAAIQGKITALQKRFGKGRKGLFALRFNVATKSRLESQLSEFESFTTFVENAIENNPASMDEKLRNQFEAFSKHYDNILNYNEYKDMVNIMGAIGDKILNQYGSHNIVELFVYTDKNKRGSIGKILIDVYKSSKGKGYTVEELLDEVYDRVDALQ